MLCCLFSKFDTLAKLHGMHKIDIICDVLMAPQIIKLHFATIWLFSAAKKVLIDDFLPLSLSRSMALHPCWIRPLILAQTNFPFFLRTTSLTPFCHLPVINGPNAGVSSPASLAASLLHVRCVQR